MRAPARRPAVAWAAVFLLGVLVAGCGGSEEPDGPEGAEGAEAAASGDAREPDEATRTCRTQWRDLRNDAAESRAEAAVDRDPGTGTTTAPPSELPSRWTSVEGTIAYYVTTASPADCRGTLTAQRESVEQLLELEQTLAPYDMERRAIELGVAAGSDVELPQGDGVPPRRRLERAVETLRTDAARATNDQGPAWQQAQVVDLDDDGARQQAAEDLELLSQESAAWRRCREAARLLERALDG